MNYNVCGLKSKLSDQTFIEYITNCDFITLTETFVHDDFDATVFRNYDCFVSTAKKISKHGRFSGGIVVLVKKCLSCFVSHVMTENANIIALKLSKELFGSNVDVMFISAYIQPYDSPFWTNAVNGYGLEIIEECIMSLHNKHGSFLMIILKKMAVTFPSLIVHSKRYLMTRKQTYLVIN